jgi:hypothetical protein
MRTYQVAAPRPDWMLRQIELGTPNLNQLLANYGTAIQPALANIENLTSAYKAFADSFRFSIPAIDPELLRRVLDEHRQVLPPNLHDLWENDDIDLLEEVARITLEEGIPLAWVPRTDLVRKLTSAATPGERAELLAELTDEVLRDCDAIVLNAEDDWSRQCANAISAFRDGHDAPAQSHAANIIDSIVLAVGGGAKARNEAAQAAQTPYDDIPFRLFGQMLTVRPLDRVFTPWFATDGTPVPHHFARHATAHAVGQPGVFDKRHALVAVMLATSLTAQFRRTMDEPPSD